LPVCRHRIAVVYLGPNNLAFRCADLFAFSRGESGIIGMFNFRSLRRKINRSLKRRGPLGTLKRCVQEPYFLILEYQPSKLRWRRRDKEFDRRYGVNTAGTIPLSALDVDDENWEHGFAYQPTDPEYFEPTVGQLPIEFEKFTFVDVGSGMGRVLLLATEFPFRRILGLEISERLHEIAEQNILRYRHRSVNLKCGNVQAVRGDAAAFEIPNDPCVVYLFNPFQEEIMGKFLANIQKSLRKWPRKLYVVYRTPLLASMLDNSGFLMKIRAEHGYAVYTNVDL
jgi:SAM-dependent methyltransferase